MPEEDKRYELSDILKVELRALKGDAEVAAQLAAAAAQVRPMLSGDPPPSDEQIERKKVYDAAYHLNLSALCLSGGGIRSAALSLGVIQALVDHGKLLKQFNYLSTVSGGGYIGSWLSAWLRHAGNADRVLDRLGSVRSASDQEAPPLRHLREYSDYLTPRIGLFSADTWAAIAIVLRNIFVNWLILVPALALMVIAVKLITLGLVAPPDSGALAKTAGGRAILGLFALFCVICGGFGFGYKLGRLYISPVSQGGPAETESKSQGRFLVFSLLPATLAGFFFVWLARQQQTPVTALFRAVSPERATTLHKWLDERLRWLEPNWALYINRLIAALLFAFLVYLFAILFAGACRACLNLRVSPPRRPFGLAPKDFLCWMGGVAVFAVLVSIGALVEGTLPHHVVLYRQVYIVRDSLVVVLGVPWFLMATMFAHTVYLLLRSHSDKGEIEREWLGRASGWHFIAAFGWLALSAIVLLGPAIFYHLTTAVNVITAVSGAVTGFLGKSGLTPAKGSATGRLALSANIVLAVAGPLFAAGLLILLSVSMDAVVVGWGKQCFPTNDDHWTCETAWWLLPLSVSILVLWMANYFANINSFALHAIYRNRLVRCFLGGARMPNRHAEGFTDFDWDDDLRVADLWPAATLPVNENWRPLHVINMTLNLTATNRLAWQQRKAAPFSVTPFACGNPELGYRGTRFYGGPLYDGPQVPPERGHLRSGISLGSAMAISGAAVSSNMGYHSSMSLSFLLTFFNVRLGVWLGNPKIGQGKKAPYAKPGPRYAILPLLSELFGLTTAESSNIYLSDGGHFEDLALYEMVRRRCRWIIVVDGDRDGNRGFEDLGNAVRKIWIDLGAKITFTGSPLLQADEETKLGVIPYFAEGTIEYLSDPKLPGLPPTVRTGKILYIKPIVRGDEAAADVIAYKRGHSDFPAQPTSDQWFDESQFEAYRRLGHLMTEQIIAATGLDRTDPTPEALFAGLENVDLLTMTRKTDPLADAIC